MKKREVVVVIILIVIFSILGIVMFFNNEFFIENIKGVIGKQIQEDGAISNIDTTVVDVTGVVIGEETEHEHIYKTKYDEIHHWEECVSCGIIQNDLKHEFSREWMAEEEVCNSKYNDICRCGYSIEGRWPHVLSGEVRGGGYFAHGYVCEYCGVTGFVRDAVCYDLNGNICKYEYEQCTDENGNKLDCKHLGTCAVCGYDNYEPLHGCIITSELDNIDINSELNLGAELGKVNKIVCCACRETYGTCTISIDRKSNEVGYYKIVLKVKLTNGMYLDDVSEMHNFFGYLSENNAYLEECNDEGTEFTAVYEININSWVKKPFFEVPFFYGVVDGYSLQVGAQLEFYPDPVKPEILNISTGQNESFEWSKSKTIKISGTENYCNVVKVEILDDYDNVIFSGETSVSNGKYSISCTPELEASAEGRTFKAVVTDTCDNKIEKEFTVSKIDAIAPEIKSGNEVGGDWAKEKNFTFEAADRGIGNVQIAFNDVTDYELANKSGDSYLRDYKFIGDVYKPTEARVFYKDGIGNISTRGCYFG